MERGWSLLIANSLPVTSRRLLRFDRIYSFVLGHFSCINQAEPSSSCHLTYVSCFVHPADLRPTWRMHMQFPSQGSFSCEDGQCDVRPPRECRAGKRSSGRGIKKKISTAVKHGLRAETLSLVGRGPAGARGPEGSLRTPACSPGDDVEERLVDDAVVYTWQQDRARRAQAKRINANITNYGVAQGQTDEKDVEDLGRRLFTDRMGPVTFYPTGSNYDEGDFERDPTTSFAGNGKMTPIVPPPWSCPCNRCCWAANGCSANGPSSRRSSTRASPGSRPTNSRPSGSWASSLSTPSTKRMWCFVFLASYVLKPARRWWYWKILMEMTDDDTRRFRRSAADRQLRSLKPKDATQARQVLSAIIERATERLTAKAEAHRERARVMAELVPDILAFDDTPVRRAPGPLRSGERPRPRPLAGRTPQASPRRRQWSVVSG